MKNDTKEKSRIFFASLDGEEISATVVNGKIEYYILGEEDTYYILNDWRELDGQIPLHLMQELMIQEQEQ